MKWLVFALLFIGCSKPVDCWQCDVMNQKTNESVKSLIFCDKEWSQIIIIADSLSTFGATYTKCSKL